MSDEMLDNIFKLLEKNKIEQKDFANAIGIKPQVVSDWKSGRNKSYKKYVFQIAEFFHVSTDYLISSGYTESIKKAPAGAEEEYLNNLRKELNDLTEEEIDEFITIAKYIKSKRQKK